MATTIRNQKLFCLNCGGEFSFNFPVELDEMSKKIQAFDTLHKDCKQTWKEPEVDQSKDVRQKAMWWISKGIVGISSEIIWMTLLGNEKFSVNYPYDPDDFSRCSKLLEAVPECKLKAFIKTMEQLSR